MVRKDLDDRLRAAAIARDSVNGMDGQLMKTDNKIGYFVEHCFRPAVIAQAARECRFDVGMRLSVGLLEMDVRPIAGELEVEDVQAFENLLRLGQVEFRRRPNIYER
jgi:hypothetical protein